VAKLQHGRISIHSNPQPDFWFCNEGLIAVLTMLRGDPTKVVAQCEDELALTEAGLVTLDKAAAA
jgi:hypothetical protein